MPHYLNNDEHFKLVAIICKKGNTRLYYPTQYCKFAKIKNHLNVLGVVFPTVFSTLQITYRLDSLGIKKMGALHILCLVFIGTHCIPESRGGSTEITQSYTVLCKLLFWTHFTFLFFATSVFFPNTIVDPSGRRLY
jgi:hypothetical protein